MATRKPVNNWGMSSSQPPSVEERHWLKAVIVGAVGFVGAALVGLFLVWRLPLLPQVEGSPFQYLAGFLEMAIHHFAPFLFSGGAAEMRGQLDWLTREGMLWRLVARFVFAGALGSAAGFFMAKDEARPRSSLIHMEGRKLEDGKTSIATLQRTFAPEIKLNGGDCYIHPEIQLTREQWSKHGCFIGQPGSGKTTALLQLVHQIFEKDQKALIHDVKGDFTSKFEKAMIIGPWDKRGPPWLIAADVPDKQGAQEFVVFIPVDPNQPMWGNAAQQILVGLIVDLQQRQQRTGIPWGWRSLYDHIAIRDEARLVEIMTRCNPLALDAFGAEQTAAGIMINMKADLSWIENLADAWGDPAPGSDEGFSLLDWLYNENPKYRQLILANNIRYSKMVKGYSTAMMSILNSRMMSMDFDDSETRVIWLIFDELPQLGRIPNFEKYTELGRSKGIRMWCGFQNISQMYEIYKKGPTDSLISMLGTLIVCRVGPGETANELMKLFGQRDIERINTTVSGSGAGKSVSTSFSRDKVDTFHVSELSKGLGNKVELGGVLALYVSSDVDDIHKLLWKWDKTPKHRPATVSAPWVNGVQSPAMDPEEAFMAQLDAAEEEGAQVMGEEVPDMPLPMSEEDRRRQAIAEEFSAARAKADKLRGSYEKAAGPESEAVAKIRAQTAEKTTYDESRRNYMLKERPLDPMEGMRALAAEELSNQSAFQKKASAGAGAPESELSTEAASAMHDGERLGHAAGLGQEGQHAMGVAVMAAVIADELTTPARPTDPIEIRKQQLLRERNRGRAAMMRPEFR